MANNVNARIRAAGWHLLVSVSVAALSAALVFGVWYPYPYRELSGGRQLFFLLILVDVVMGPAITLIICSSDKSRRELIADLTVVGILQLGALLYGLNTVAQARPVYVVFEYSRFRVVHAADITSDHLVRAPNDLRVLPWTGPQWIALRSFTGPSEQFDSATLDLGGTPQAAQPWLWTNYESQTSAILSESQSADRLSIRFPGEADAIKRVAAAAGYLLEDLRYLPLLDRKGAWTVLLDSKSARPIGVVQIDSF
ncbi:MAG TPA: TfpX/TfpZ family type IV pilin accessory protein [Burkholderiaceae bacterium]|jgi:hypothetical protein|nr:TfpX/TfpZ family type IV pilin accessory protein [Burkholderiaceae bacterium]